MATALQPMLPNPDPPRRTVSRVRLMELVERARMDAAEALAGAVTVQSQALAILEATGELWREIAGEDAPDVEVRASIVRAG